MAFIVSVYELFPFIDSRSSSSTSSTPRSHHRRHHQQRERHRLQPQDVTCTVGHIKVRFQGGAARLCQFLTSVFLKVYKRHLEAQVTQIHCTLNPDTDYWHYIPDSLLCPGNWCARIHCFCQNRVF